MRCLQIKKKKGAKDATHIWWNAPHNISRTDSTPTFPHAVPSPTNNDTGLCILLLLYTVAFTQAQHRANLDFFVALLCSVTNKMEHNAESEEKNVSTPIIHPQLWKVDTFF